MLLGAKYCLQVSLSVPFW